MTFITDWTDDNTIASPVKDSTRVKITARIGGKLKPIDWQDGDSEPIDLFFPMMALRKRSAQAARIAELERERDLLANQINAIQTLLHL